MKVLITGGGGFLGRFVARAFKKAGHEVSVLGRSRYEFLEKDGIHCIQGDITNRNFLIQAFSGYDEIHHIASKTGISVIEKPFYEINVRGTENVIAACEENGITRLIYTSSPSVVFGGDSQHMVDESEPYPENHLDNYSKTKAIAEKMVLDADCQSGLRTVALRPHLIWGPEDTNLIPRILERSKSGRLFGVGNGKNTGDVTYVENAAYAHVCASSRLAENSSVCGNAYFITNGEPVNLWGFINRILEGMKLPPVKKFIPFPAAWAIGSAMETVYKFLSIEKEPVMTRFLASQLASDHCYSIDRARKELGYEPFITVDDGLKILIDSILENQA